MEKVALIEGVTPEFVREGVAKGHIVIPKNKFRSRNKICGIGGGLDIKVNGLWAHPLTVMIWKWKQRNCKF